jgi:hypothetical protein
VSINAQNLSGLSDGDSVGTRPDQTDNNNDLSGSGTYLASDINGYAAVNYDPASTDNHEVTFGSAISQRVVVFAVTKTDITTDTDLHGVVAAASNRSWVSEPNAQDNGGFNIDAGALGADSSGGVDTNPTLLTAIFDGANTELRVNGTTELGPTDLGSVDWDGLNVGYIPFLGGTDYFDGSIGFAELHNGDPSNGLSTREQEIADMWDITI